jgi:signal transduction histidine kinase
VEITCYEPPNGKASSLVIAIADRGPGLTPEQQQRIFEPFFTTKAKGTGLGMAIASRIVQSHGGTIAASSPGGARIEIMLPRNDV